MSPNFTKTNTTRGNTRSGLLRICLAVGLTLMGTGYSLANNFVRAADQTRPAFAERSNTPFSLDDDIDSSKRNIERSRLDLDSSLHGSEKLRKKDPDKPATAQPARKAKAESELSEAEKIRLFLTSRYGNPVVGRFLANVSTDNVLKLYSETSRLIDGRHIQPSSYAKRTRRAMTNLLYAVGNREFLRANRISPNRETITAYRYSLKRLVAERPVHNANDALNLMYATMNMSRQQLNLSPTTVALEFVYGATESLDKYSAFAPEEPTRRPSANLEDHVVGIGVEIKPHEQGVLVVKALRGGPAAAAGLKGGDVIVSVNGRNLESRSLDYAVDQIAGPEGSRIVLGIRRGDRPAAQVTLSRRRVTIHSVSEARMLDAAGSVGYIKLDKFAKSSTAEMDRALWDLYRQGMTTLVIDLRGNPGGLLTTAIELSNRFVPAGAIVSTRGRNPQDESAEYATYDRTWKVPLAVLVDENSASASEIFAAAIQENSRGLIVGRKSYGKGTVQTHFPLESVSGNLRLTTARFYSPNGRVMAGAGVTPDIRVTAAETASFIDVDNDQDIQTAVAAAKSDRAKSMAASQSGRRNRGTPDLPL